MRLSPRSPDRQPQIPALIPAMIAVAICGFLILLVANLGRDDDSGTPAANVSTTTTLPPITTTTTTLPDPVDREPFLVGAAPAPEPQSYSITYDVVENGLARTETWLIRRPYESLVVSERDGALLTGTATSRSNLYTYLSDRESWLAVQGELHRAAFDHHPADAVAAMGALGVVEPGSDGTYLGRDCTGFRTGPPPGGGEPGPPTDAEFTELCIDDDGFVLHERWVIDDRTVTEKTAVALDLSPRIDTAAFDPSPIVEDDGFTQALSQIAVVPDESTMERAELVVTAPGGYTYDGAVFRASTTPEGGVSASEIVRFYSAGADLLEVSEHFAEAQTYLGESRGTAVRVSDENWDEVWLVPGFRVSILRFRTGEYSYAEVRHRDVRFLFEVLSDFVQREPTED